MKKSLALLLSLALAVSLSACTISDGEQTPDASGAPAASEGSTPDTSTPPADPEPITVDQEFSSGNYTAGIDFPAGTYNIVAVSGGGNVSSSNLYDGGINAILGTEDQNELMDMYEQEYKNIDLPEGTTLTIDGVQVQLVPSP